MQDFIAAHLADPSPELSAVPKRFTLTVAAPEESGSMFGWKVLRVSHFGRYALDLARLSSVLSLNGNEGWRA